MRRNSWYQWAVPLLIVAIVLAGSACTCPQLNQVPTISGLIADPATVAPGGASTITCTATDPDGDALTYAWTATGGTISGTGSAVSWIAPGAEGTYTITVTVDDGKGGTATDDVTVVVSTVNSPPVISSLIANPPSVAPSGASTITCTATDADGDTLTYGWTAAGGSISGMGSSVTWTAPALEGTYTITVTVADGNGGTDETSTAVTVATTTGSIDVQSSPAGAAIFLNGVDTGSITPFIITNVSAGGHTVRLSYYHYEDRAQPVVVYAGETTYINWALDYAPTQSVTLQPDAADGKDAYVYEGDPDDNRGTSEQICASGQTYFNRLYIQFDMSGIPSTAIVTSADLGLYYHNNSGGATQGSVGAHRVTGSWSETTITWNDQPNSASTAVDVRSVPAAATNSFRYWYIDDLVQGWIDGSMTNRGVMLKDTDEATGEGYKCFRSSDYATASQHPKLIIYYYEPSP